LNPVRALAARGRNPWLLALAIAAAACARDRGSGVLETIAGEARSAIEAYVDAVNAMDLDSAGMFYSDAPGFQWVEDGAVRYGSAREARESLAGLGAMASSTSLTLSDLSVTALGLGSAVASCHFEQEIGTEGGSGFSYSGAMTIVLRNDDGRWLFASGHTSTAATGPGERP